jgi:DNA invertase Pin-like site-specific DNA recombinase
MSDITKIGASHLSRAAYVYLRQSSAAQVEHNRESTQRQYALVTKASTLGWPAHQIVVIDEDLGLSGAGVVERSGFARLTAEVALGHVGIVLGLEVSRLARNNADWYRLLDLCGLTDTLIGDADGLYHPAMFNDRLLLGLKGTMSEAELHVLRARLNGGIRNKAAPRRAASWPSRRLRLGRGRWRSAVPSRRGGLHRHPHRIYQVQRARISSPRLAVVAQRRLVVSAADSLWRRHPLGRPQLYRRLSCADESRLRGRLRLRQEPP